MSNSSRHHVTQCTAWLRLCFVLILWTVYSGVTPAASGSSRPRVTPPRRPVPTPPKKESRQNSKGLLVGQLGMMFENGNANATHSELKSTGTPHAGKGGRDHGDKSSTAAVGNEPHAVSTDPGRGGKRTAKLKHMLEQGKYATTPDRSESRTMRDEQAVARGLLAGAGVTNSSHSGRGHVTRAPPRRFRFSPENNAGNREDGELSAACRGLGQQEGTKCRLPRSVPSVASTSTPEPQFDTRPEEPIYANVRPPPLCTKPAVRRVPSVDEGCWETRTIVPVKVTPLQSSHIPPGRQRQPDTRRHTEEEIYDDVGSICLEARGAAYSSAQEPQNMSAPHITAKLLTRRRDGSGRRAPRRRKSISTAGWSLRTFFAAFSNAYAPFSLPLIIAGYVCNDTLMSVVGLVMMCGGTVFNVLSLLALRLRRLPLTHVIPFTAYNFSLIFGIPRILAPSILAVTNMYTGVLCGAVARAGIAVLLPSVAVITASTMLIGLIVSVAALRDGPQCGCFRRRRATTDPELTLENADDIQNQLSLDFETVSSGRADANNDSEDVTGNALLRACLSCSSRLAHALRMNFYSLFVTVAGASLATAVCLARNVNPRSESESAPGQVPYVPDLDRLPLWRSNNLLHYNRPTASSFAAPSFALVAVGLTGVAYIVFAILGAAFRLLRHCATTGTQTETHPQRQNRWFDIALTCYPLLVGIVTAGFGFLTTVIDVSFTRDDVFQTVVEHGVALFGAMLALVPPLWSTFQCLGGSLRSTLLHHLAQERRREAALGAEAATHSPGNFEIPPEAQNTDASHEQDDYSSTEWEEDDV